MLSHTAIKICFLSSVHPVFDARIFHREAASLVKHGFHVTLIIPHDGTDGPIQGIEVKSLPKPESRFHRFFSLWRLLILALKERADVYHFHDPDLIPIGILLRLITRKTVVYDVHEHYPDTIRIRKWLPSWAREIIARLFDWIERTVAPLFSAIVTADEAVSERFRKVHARVLTLYNYPRIDFCDSQKKENTLRKGPLSLVYIGDLNEDRGYLLMLDIMRILLSEKGIDVRLRLAGWFDSEEDCSQFLRAVEKDSVLTDRVTWSGVLSQAEIGPWLMTSDIGLVPLQPVPKFYKNIPTKMFDYMACGLPIIGSDLPPIRRYVDESKAGLLATPDDPHSFAEKIAFLAHHWELCLEMGKNGRTAFENLYNWDTEEKKLMALYSHFSAN